MWYNRDMVFTRKVEEPENDFFSHLSELRQRLIYCVLVVSAGFVLGWFLYPQAYALIAYPIFHAIERAGGVVMTQHPAEAFFIQMKMAGMIALLVASPFILWQLWAFISPGLTEREQRAVRPIMPFICVLFLLGAALAYLMMPGIMHFFLAYIPKDVHPNVDFEQSINFPLKVIVAFGLAFQLPVLVLGLVALRILTPKVLLGQWRYAIVIIAIIAAVITPTADPYNFSLMMAPLLVLYFGTVLFAYKLYGNE